MADVAISVGVISILLFQRSFFSSEANMDITETNPELTPDSLKEIESSSTNEESEKQKIITDDSDLEIDDTNQKNENDLT